MNAPFTRSQASIAAQHLCSGQPTPPHAWLYNPYTPVGMLHTVCAPVRYVGKAIFRAKVR